jgi:hypothetical protein
MTVLETPKPAPTADDRRDCPFCVSPNPAQREAGAFCTAAGEAM